MKRILLLIIPFLVLLTQPVFSQDNTGIKTETEAYKDIDVSIEYYNKTIFYADNSENNPVYVHITIANHSKKTFRFKLADDRSFSLDFDIFTVKNENLSQTDSLIKKRTTNQTVYFREISLESGEEYSFVENVKNFITFSEPSIYYMRLIFYPEMYKSKYINLTSNRLTLDMRPSSSAASASLLPIQKNTAAVLTPEAISPDKVVEQTIIARQKSLWDQYFLYMDVESMLLQDPVRARKYKMLSSSDRIRMLENYKIDLMQSRIDQDIVSIPEKFMIEKTVYSTNEGTVEVIEWFKYANFREKKRYTYHVRQRDGIWQIYSYNVDNLGTE